ncbi:DUF3347 domain-containing protein [Aquimarina muelleri]|uniref:DUF3347 domain-containing protein n=1 Tax=Aquimarina muelleri TaxID=279356 RepID=A0A918JXY5_9FLAO|nr:DUF3347 domain-containing protein [Aquimarina muelleri]MCX2763615.1 DUF3347 domain-containing protein [Aquimarina muelleri]GGX26605.1 hypothetical protein GCM10007384_29630 [Aquimarina muelleri]
MRYLIVVLILGGLNASCTADKKSKKIEPVIEDEKIDYNKDYDSTDSQTKVVFSQAKDQQIFDLYLSIKKALVNSNEKEVQSQAKKLGAVIKDFDEDKQLKAISKLIALTKDIHKQRDFFVGLTHEIEKHINKVDITSGEIYQQFCPMVFEGKGGYWFSNSKEIRNPYFGKKMLTSGSVKKIFK